MADTKITQLQPPQVGYPVVPATDVLPIVVIADPGMATSGSTRKVTVNQLLGAGGTATLASATITGDLTVDTSTLKVDSANNRVGIGTASPTSDLDIFRASGSGITSGISLRTAAGAGGDGSFIKWLAGGTNEKVAQIDGVLNGTDVGYLSFQCGNGADAMAEQYRVASSGLFTWYDGAGGTRMTLNSTGLGVGISPSYKLNIGAANPTGGNIAQFYNNATSSLNGAFCLITQFGVQDWYMGQPAGVSAFTIGTGTTSKSEFFRIDSSGNVGIGVTPITSHILSCAGPVGITGTTAGTRTSYITNSSAASLYYTDGGGSGYFTDFGNLIIQPRTSAARSVVIATGSTTPVERAVVKSTGQVRFVPLAADPAGAEAGDVYYNSVSNRLKYYNGTAWTLI